MDDLKQAYKMMGLEEFAPREEVEKRYTTLMRRERSRARSNEDGESDFAKVTEAYRLILAYEDQKFTQTFNEQEYGKYKNMAGQAQKLDHFWRYYKFHTLGAIALVALIIYGIVSYIDHREHEKYLASLPPIDLDVSFMGTFLEQDGSDTEDVTASMLKSFPEWKRMQSNIIFVPGDEANQYAHLQKAMVTLISEKPDVYILDRFMFEWIGQQDVLMKLEEIPGLAEAAGGEFAQSLKTESNPDGSVYGFDLSETQLFKDLPLMKGDLIVGIRAGAERSDHAIKFIQQYLDTSP